MIIKWNRETLLVILMGIMILIGAFYYGNLYLIESVKVEADAVIAAVENQEALMASYPPSEELHEEFQVKYSDTETFLPNGVEINRELVRLEGIANQANVAISSLTRSADQLAVEVLSEDYQKNTYEVQMTSTSSASFRRLIDLLMAEERVWNITSFTYTKAEEENYTGTMTFDLYYLNQHNEIK